MKVINKKATFEYHIVHSIEAGIQLTGPEVKSIKGGHVKLDGAFVKIIGNEAFLVNAHVFPYIHARIENYDPKRTRKLLLHKKQIYTLQNKVESSHLTLIPTKIYTIGPRIKLEIAVARGKKKYDKRESKKKKDLSREIERDYKEKVK